MSSVVTDVLNSAGILAKEDIPSKVESLRRKIEDIKMEVQERLKSRYIDFLPQYVKLDKLTGNLQSAKNEYENLHYFVEKEIKPQMSTSVSEYQELFNDLKKISILKQAVSDIIDMHKNLDASKYALDRKFYCTATQHLLKFEQKVNGVYLEHQRDIDIFFALKTEFHVAKENTIYNLGEEWKQRVIFSTMEKSKSNVTLNELTFHLKSVDTFTEAIQALEQLRQLDPVLKSFGSQFLRLICEPIILKTAGIKAIDTTEKKVITVSVTKDNIWPPALQSLTELFQALQNSFFTKTLMLNADTGSAETKTLMMKFGELVSNDFLTMLVEKCLKLAVPSQSQDLEDYERLIHDVVNFQNFLVEIGFLSTEENALFQFVQKANELPANKMSLDLVSQARELMKRDLHKTIMVGRKETSEDSSVDSNADELSHMVQGKCGLHRKSFEFPLCQISVFAEDLVKLLRQVVQEAKKLQSKNSSYAMKLYCTARSISELYCCVVPTYHKDEIANIPQQAAIHHNNCMYIAHCLLSLGQGRNPLRLPLPVTFVDLVPEIRKIGAEAFLAQMRLQRQHILQLLQDPEAFQDLSQDDSLVNRTEKTVRQCLHQLELLKRVWSDVLPLEVYFKAIGTLLNTFLDEIIQHVCSMEDIAAHSAAQFDSVFAIVLKESPELFKVTDADKRDMVHKYVLKWFKFQELQLVLGANLIEIVDRWASGKGPLASHFTADEVKHLIRALFQNTERRAAALGKIR